MLLHVRPLPPVQQNRAAEQHQQATANTLLPARLQKLGELSLTCSSHSGNASCSRSNTNPRMIPQMIQKHVTEAYGTSSSKKMPYACAGCASTSPAPTPRASMSRPNPFCFVTVEVPLRATAADSAGADEPSGATTKVLSAALKDHMATAPTVKRMTAGRVERRARGAMAL